MAAPVTARARAIVLGCVLAAGATALFAAEPLIDPTRSPLPGRGDESATAAPAPAPVPTRLQMIVRGPGETRTAVIDGTKVAVGDTLSVRGATTRVERITETTVVLAHCDVKETLQLLPGTERAVRCTRPTATQRPGGC
jgi:hypothetical protein